MDKKIACEICGRESWVHETDDAILIHPCQTCMCKSYDRGRIENEEAHKVGNMLRGEVVDE